MFDAVHTAAQVPGAIRGYIKGEFLPIDEDTTKKPFDPSVSVPLRAIQLGNDTPRSRCITDVITTNLDSEWRHPADPGCWLGRAWTPLDV